VDQRLPGGGRPRPRRDASSAWRSAPTFIRSVIVQGIIADRALGFSTAQIFPRIKATKVSGWITMFECCVLGKGMLLGGRVCAKYFLSP
jgi:hypothetical protein